MQIYGYQKTTLLDYPGHVAATIFTAGCNFRCPFCHNSNLLSSPDDSVLVPEEIIFSFLEKRKKILSQILSFNNKKIQLRRKFSCSPRSNQRFTHP